ncbi:hypothetical protein ACWCZ5_33340 [Streptomyces sp. NPDC001667]
MTGIAVGVAVRRATVHGWNRTDRIMLPVLDSGSAPGSRPTVYGVYGDELRVRSRLGVGVSARSGGAV